MRGMLSRSARTRMGLDGDRNGGVRGGECMVWMIWMVWMVSRIGREKSELPFAAPKHALSLD